MVQHGVRERAEDHASLGELLLECRRHRDAVEYGVDRHAREPRAFVQRHAELLVGRQQFRVDFIEALRAVLLGLRRRVVRDRLVIDRRDAQVRPVGLAHREPVPNAFSRQSSMNCGSRFLQRNHAHDVLVEAGRQRVRLDVRDEAVLVFLRDERVEVRWCSGHCILPQIRPGPRGRGRSTRATRRSSGRQTATASWPASCASEISSSERRIAPIDALPGIARAAGRLAVASAVVAAALGDGDGTFDRIDDGRGADAVRRPRELVSAVACHASTSRSRPGENISAAC